MLEKSLHFDWLGEGSITHQFALKCNKITVNFATNLSTILTRCSKNNLLKDYQRLCDNSTKTSKDY